LLRPKLFCIDTNIVLGEIIKERYHPNAYLQNVRNVKGGLLARTKIIEHLETNSGSACEISRVTMLSYEVAFHHLRRLEKEGVVDRKEKRPFIWELTGLGQKRLDF
jgi:DNA-binding transcriptional ArsR family regulator